MVCKPSNTTLLNMWWVVLYVQISSKRWVERLAPDSSNIPVLSCLLSTLSTFMNLIPLPVFFFSHLQPNLSFIWPYLFCCHLASLTPSLSSHGLSKETRGPVDLFQPIPPQGLQALGTESCVIMWAVMAERQFKNEAYWWAPSDLWSIMNMLERFGVTVKIGITLGKSGWDETVPGDVRQHSASAYLPKSSSAAQWTSTSGFPVCAV